MFGHLLHLRAGTSRSDASAYELDADAKVMSHRWSAAAGIDLEDPEIQVVRAFVESRDAYHRTHDYATTYPGFEEIFPPMASPFPRRGTTHHYLLEATASTNPLGWNITQVSVCDDHSQRAKPEPGTWKTLETESFYSFEVRRVSSTVPQPPLDPARRLAYPTWNVFEGWEIVSVTDSATEEAPVATKCRFEMSLADPTAEFGRKATRPPPVLPFTPGWPEQIEDDKNE